MKPSPVINVTSSAPSAAAKPAGGSSSDQSFGHVLAQQVNGTTASSSSSSANGRTQNADASSANAANAGDASTSGAAASKTVKAKHSPDDNSATGTTQTGSDTSTANGSAQLLALVSNVQQAATGTAGGSTPSTDPSDGTNGAVGALTGNAAAGAQAALANFQAAVSNGTTANNTATAAAATADLTKEAKDALLQETAPETEDIAAGGEQSGTAAPRAEQQAVSPLSVDTQNTASTQAAADLAANAQKDLQADIANLDQAAAKSADAIQNTIATANAAPAMVNDAQINAVANQVTGASDKLTPQVGTPGWDQALGQKVVWMVAGGQQSASLTLNPPDLGPMQVVLNVTNSHATATFTAAQPEVRQALETAMPKLREMLGDAGIQLGQTSVNAGNAQQQNFAGQASRQSNGGIGERRVDAIDGAGAIAPQSATKTSGIGLVDTFA